jgi:hypothetical protein
MVNLKSFLYFHFHSKVHFLISEFEKDKRKTHLKTTRLSIHHDSTTKKNYFVSMGSEKDKSSLVLNFRIQLILFYFFLSNFGVF